jgi:hypothetical protein
LQQQHCSLKVAICLGGKIKTFGDDTQEYVSLDGEYIFFDKKNGSEDKDTY